MRLHARRARARMSDRTTPLAPSANDGIEDLGDMAGVGMKTTAADQDADNHERERQKKNEIERLSYHWACPFRPVSKPEL
jgi:hypothetical protein